MLLYIAGSAQGIVSILVPVAQAANTRIFAPDYRLLPEYTLQDAIDDCVAGYQKVLNLGVKPKDIVIAGDSAGAALAIYVTKRLLEKNNNSLVPSALVLLSPW